MTIETKFSIGDKVWKPEQRYTYVPMFQCPVCKGSGNSAISPGKRCASVIDGNFKCVDGMICEGKFEYVPAYHIITDVIVEYSKYDTYIEYNTEDNACTISESCFSVSEEACQQVCNELNQEERK